MMTGKEWETYHKCALRWRGVDAAIVGDSMIGMKKSCESCLMPFAKDLGPRESDRYCSYCFRDGSLTYTGTDRKEFQRLSYEGMIKNGMHPLTARFFAWTIRFAPRWRGKSH